MTKDILVTFKGIQMEQGTGVINPIEVISPGAYFFKNNKHYILYEELSTDPVISTHTTLKIYDGIVEILRRGPIDSRIVFEKGKIGTFLYTTSIGSFEITIDTSDILFEESENNLHLNVDYYMDINGYGLDCVFNLTIVPMANANLHLNT